MENSVKYPDRESIKNLLESEKFDFKIMDHEPLLTIPPALEHFEKNKPEITGKYNYCKNAVLYLDNEIDVVYIDIKLKKEGK